MDTAKVEGDYGTYRVRHGETARERRITWWITAVAVVLLAGWCVIGFQRDGFEGALKVALYVVVIAAVNVMVRLARRWWEPQTRLDTSGVRVMTGLTGGRRVIAWDEITEVRAASRFTGHPVVVLRDGGQVKLPGVPAAVGERLCAAATEGGRKAVLPLSPPAAPSVNGDDAWEGPFRQG
ncbi:PH domain-containing protein [Streptomyces sp. NP160]|uniref:PH domain-containing protein n=1 Tax=Streptomyces sp. NP160 TaxID=2586637 RepID=UPI001119AF79|nr:PH domain-containing protein [Streptomyces sp. NP160]TNM59804.1 PH domain-containing protein [Streptomyces sp. NP160]